MPDNGGKRLKEEYETIDLRELFLLVKKNILMILAVTIASAAGISCQRICNDTAI